MGLLVVGSVAFDSIETPFGQVEEVLGGSATYASLAASYFSEVQLVGVVGEDFGEDHLQLYRVHGIDTEGLIRAKGQTFRWRGKYGYDLNEAITLETRLNVFEAFSPDLPESFRGTEYVFLANIDPKLQLRVLEQVHAPRWVACDTMNFWIRGTPELLRQVLERVDMVMVNEAEARELVGEPNVIKAARKIASWGPRVVIIKRGEFGAFMVSEENTFLVPAYPLESVYDPTGAGDSFAGGLMGYLAHIRDEGEMALRQGVVLGAVMASFNVEDFSCRRLTQLGLQEIQGRYEEIKGFTTFQELRLAKRAGEIGLG